MIINDNLHTNGKKLLCKQCKSCNNSKLNNNNNKLNAFKSIFVASVFNWQQTEDRVDLPLIGGEIMQTNCAIIF